MSSAHVLRVKKLYRHSLKNLLNWCVHRDLWIKKGFDLRAEFEANRHVQDAKQVEKLVAAGEAKLKAMMHPDPYTIPTDPGGSKYMRWHNLSSTTQPGFPPNVTAMPSWLGVPEPNDYHP
uniref:NADH dehydrogenase [ubiquinone] 1 beta subcomplex subunit 9 n=1 Tax=Emiliania huxleyi TaxID=2903 RepID=A0A6S9VBV5_EMIHU|mmetsp:Transcript_6347/g.18448  ORF Transcript_6347/g.18448 Transcript_6347/m.18448 type:complete len:120 (+) Transcript_6347:42-401(+)